jgi:hypothetical protein
VGFIELSSIKKEMDSMAIRPDGAEEYDVTNFKPRGTYTKEEIEKMENAKLKCLELLKKIQQETKQSKGEY